MVFWGRGALNELHWVPKHARVLFVLVPRAPAARRGAGACRRAAACVKRSAAAPRDGRRTRRAPLVEGIRCGLRYNMNSRRNQIAILHSGRGRGCVCVQSSIFSNRTLEGAIDIYALAVWTLRKRFVD